MWDGVFRLLSSALLSSSTCQISSPSQTDPLLNPRTQPRYQVNGTLRLGTQTDRILTTSCLWTTHLLTSDLLACVRSSVPIKSKWCFRFLLKVLIQSLTSLNLGERDFHSDGLGFSELRFPHTPLGRRQRNGPEHRTVPPDSLGSNPQRPEASRRKSVRRGWRSPVGLGTPRPTVRNVVESYPLEGWSQDEGVGPSSPGRRESGRSRGDGRGVSP